MDINLFCKTYPRLFHMAHAAALPGIERHGLLSTSALLTLFEVESEDRERLESQHRPQNSPLRHPAHGTAILRDQKPMSDALLSRCVSDATPTEWYRLLNSKVFFWVNEERLKRLLGARAYRSEDQLVLTLDTAKVVQEYVDDIWLCPMNSGCCRPFPHPRTTAIFQKIADYDFEEWRKKRGGSADAVVECAVEGAIRDVSRFLVKPAEIHPAVRPRNAPKN